MESIFFGVEKGANAVLEDARYGKFYFQRETRISDLEFQPRGGIFSPVLALVSETQLLCYSETKRFEST
jgi:hypothetical protein